MTQIPNNQGMLKQNMDVGTLEFSVAIINNNDKYADYVLWWMIDIIMSNKEFKESNIICISLQ